MDFGRRDKAFKKIRNPLHKSSVQKAMPLLMISTLPAALEPPMLTFSIVPHVLIVKRIGGLIVPGSARAQAFALDVPFTRRYDVKHLLGVPACAYSEEVLCKTGSKPSRNDSR